MIPSWAASDPGCRLLEVDFSGIEAVLTAWYAEDPLFVRRAKLGVHAFLTGQVEGIQVDFSLPDQEVSRQLKAIKKSHLQTYDVSKRTVHGTHYLLSPYGMHRNFPKTFPSIAFAEQFQEAYYQLVPALRPWQRRMQQTAERQHYLGGAGAYPKGHPHGYKHWFWGVASYQPISFGEKVRYDFLKKQGKRVPEILTLHGRPFRRMMGDDAKRSVAFYPQSTAAGILCECCLLLFSPDSSLYIGDAYYGRTPLRAPIHDSLLLEIPVRIWDRVLEKVTFAMTMPRPELPIPPAWLDVYPALSPDGLTIGVEAKAGKDWLHVEGVDVTSLEYSARTLTPDMRELIADGRIWEPDSPEEDEDVAALVRGVLDQPPRPPEASVTVH